MLFCVEINVVFVKFKKFVLVGYFIGLYICFVVFLMQFQIYNKEWLQWYFECVYVFCDLIIVWGFLIIGVCWWSVLFIFDLFLILQDVVDYGLNFGLVVVYGFIKLCIIVVFVYDKCEFMDDEIEMIFIIFWWFYDIIELLESLIKV